MTDAHTHVASGERVCEVLIGRDFFGIHPWDAAAADDVAIAAVRQRIAGDGRFGVGEIGLDRLKERQIPSRMRDVFVAQLAIAADCHRPVVLHGAKCWGQVVAACRPFAGRIPAFVFHGFSRSGGLLPEIAALNGFISIGPAILNDHAVNYREMAKGVPIERLLVETDRTQENAATCPSVFAVAAKLAELRGISADELERQIDRNAMRAFGETLPPQANEV